MRGRPSRRCAIAALVLAGAAVLGPASRASAGAVASGGGGASVQSLQAQAATIVADIAAGGDEVRALSAQYLADQAQSAVLAHQLAASDASLRTAQAATAGAQAALSQAAVDAYVSDGDQSSLSLILSPGGTGAADPVTGQAYLAAAAGQFQDDQDAYESASRALAVQVAAVRSAARSLAAELAAIATTRSRALAELADERTLLADVHGQLAALVAAQLAARQAAAEAAARAAAAAQAAQAAQAARAQAAAAAAAAAAASAGHGGAAAGSGSGSAGAGAGGGGGGPASLRADFASLRMCESGDNYAENTGNGYYGAYQFAASTWEGLGYAGLPSAAPPAEQDAGAYRLWQQDGWSPWPACSALLGL